VEVLHTFGDHCVHAVEGFEPAKGHLPAGNTTTTRSGGNSRTKTAPSIAASRSRNFATGTDSETM
jgi:hypothetical protein